MLLCCSCISVVLFNLHYLARTGFGGLNQAPDLSRHLKQTFPVSSPGFASGNLPSPLVCPASRSAVSSSCEWTRAVFLRVLLPVSSVTSVQDICARRRQAEPRFVVYCIHLQISALKCHKLCSDDENYPFEFHFIHLCFVSAYQVRLLSDDWC